MHGTMGHAWKELVAVGGHEWRSGSAKGPVVPAPSTEDGLTPGRLEDSMQMKMKDEYEDVDEDEYGMDVCNNEDEIGMMMIMMAMRIGRMMMTITRMDT